jgi:hypothetical protein
MATQLDAANGPDLVLHNWWQIVRADDLQLLFCSYTCLSRVHVELVWHMN